MFYGEYQHAVDAKGRIFIPAKFREGLGEKFIVTKGLDQCLFVYSGSEWSEIEGKLKGLPFTNKDVRSFVRFFFSGACECEVDKQGRILLPQNLREYAGLVSEASVIGVSSRVEIWERSRWETYTDEESVNTESLASKMAELGI